ncbi:hypothetical protein SELMODRAFT_428512 [Selaginella moellendorffii]|uniref:Uncharacterized protein n=1 Tax=Selaginella moellendorffii TaxID=88036 RepID=D8T332_SELML|nr:hypothetical protein SELMODRAFT_428512 [Selaginella moellendorffii]
MLDKKKAGMDPPSTRMHPSWPLPRPSLHRHLGARSPEQRKTEITALFAQKSVQTAGSGGLLGGLQSAWWNRIKAGNPRNRHCAPTMPKDHCCLHGIEIYCNPCDLMLAIYRSFN